MLWGDTLSPMPAAQTCAICTDGRATVIDTLLAAGRSPGFIEREMKRLDRPTKAETILRHRRNCLKGIIDNPHLLQGAANNANGLTGDFAVLVRAEAERLLKAGQLRINANHGLAAQALLDRRAEKAADRDLVRNLALLMSGAHVPVPRDLINVTPDEDTGTAGLDTDADSVVLRLPAATG